MKIKFNSDDLLPLNKTMEIPATRIVVTAVFHENNICYPQVFLDEYLYNLYLRTRKLSRSTKKQKLFQKI